MKQRIDPVTRMRERAQRAALVKNSMAKGPIQRLGEAIITAVEDVQGLNIGGSESGRIAKEKTIKKAEKKRMKTERFAP